jgi:hypothetical protein
MRGGKYRKKQCRECRREEMVIVIRRGILPNKDKNEERD